MKYTSKIGVIFISILFVFLVLGVLLFFQEIWIGLVFDLLLLAFLFHLFFTTHYTINDNVLHVCCSFWVNEFITISSIKKIQEAYSILSAPAISLDRLEIHYNKFDSIIVSPKDKTSFVNHLREINPEIEYVEEA